jgi:integrase/recombinase XerD
MAFDILAIIAHMQPAAKPYMPAKLIEGKVWYITFYALHPNTHKLTRKRIKVNRVEHVPTRRRWALGIVEKINQALDLGWNPWTESKMPSNTTLFDALDLFAAKRYKHLSSDTVRSYKSHISKLKDWAIEERKADLLAGAFTAQTARQYLEYQITSLKLSERTYNNCITFGNVIFNWMQGQEIIQVNPFAKIPRLRTKVKKRQLIPQEQRADIVQHIEKNDSAYLICIYLLFYTELRPTEQTKLLVGDVKLSHNIIEASAAITKNKKARYPTIPEHFSKYLHSLGLDQYPPHYRLISTGWIPGPDPINPRQISRKWDSIRRDLKLPAKFQFYSLRDSGIVHMLNQGVKPHQVMIQSGHSNLDMTATYSSHILPEANQAIKDIVSGF